MPGFVLCLPEAPTSLPWKCQACSEGHRGSGDPVSSRDVPSGSLGQTQEFSNIHDLHQRLPGPSAAPGKRGEEGGEGRASKGSVLWSPARVDREQQAEHAGQDGFLPPSESSCCNFPGLLIDWSQPAHPSPPIPPTEGPLHHFCLKE